MHPKPSPTAQHQHWFRDDITGLRALAIVPVVAFHAGVPGFDGGFTGVDVFFVISGYLITTLLLREIDRHGRIRLAHFWARRIRRLTPASVTMVIVTLVVGAMVLSPLDLSTLAGQSAAAATYTANIVFALDPSGYFAEDLGVPNPFLHTWSLAVEEQFYLVWPGLIGLAVLLARGRSVRVRLLVVFATVAALSLVASIVFTPTHPNAAFYLLPTRAWEFAVAGMLALVPAGRLGPAWLRATMVAVGLVTLAAVTVGFSEALAFPGWVAIVPVAATMLIIAGGRGPATWPSRLLALPPLRVIGELSYSWYLWHWPFLVLMTEVWGQAASVRGASAVLSLGVAYLSYKYIEHPMRFHPRLSASAVRTFAAGLTATACVIVASGIVFSSGERAQAENIEIVEAREADPEAGCAQSDTCILGDPQGDRTVVMYGDSHAGHWKEALDEAARLEQVRLVVRWRSSCPAVTVYIVNTSGRHDARCGAFRDHSVASIDEYDADAVLLSHAEGYLGRIRADDGSELSTADQLAAWERGYEEVLAVHSGRTIGVIRDNPRFDHDPNDCLAEQSAEACAVPRSTALEPIAELRALGTEVLAAHPIAVEFSSVDLMCDASTCQVSDGGLPIFRDYNHLARDWTLTQVPELRGLLRDLVGPADAPAAL
ncbi:acyltransferase family protein [Agromyces rhizosphaerae]|nr:acyltransferase family protein [Agromyces rhizosphaerae]